ncbi:hypothetical protein DM45_1575 [Burkholderia mallei]|nr:hypothetical protein DM45_1575 [Burkholderia mallei]
MTASLGFAPAAKLVIFTGDVALAPPRVMDV